MIQLAFISSLNFPELSDLGHIEMALTPLVLEHKEYAERLRCKSIAGKYVILDNGAFEMQQQGRGVSWEVLDDAAQTIQANEVICPDVLYDWRATVDATKEYLAHTKMPPGTSFMGVPQGNNPAEWMMCAVALCQIPEIRSIGLSKLSVPKCFTVVPGEPLSITRKRALQAFKGQYSNRRMEIHLLGGDWSLALELKYYRALGHAVRSNDSSFAYWYGYNEFVLGSHNLPVDFIGEFAIAPSPPNLSSKPTIRQRSYSRSIAYSLRTIAEGGKS